MVTRYSAQGSLAPATNGTYVAASDYDKLAGALQCVVSAAGACFKQIEVGELSSEDAEAALMVCAELAQP